MKLKRFQDLVDQLKAQHEGMSGPVNAVQSQALLADLAAYWPHCKRMEHLPACKGTNPWDAVSVDAEDLGEALCTTWHTALRLLRRAQDLGVIYPDGTVQDGVKAYLWQRGYYAVVPAVLGAAGSPRVPGTR